jgi:hypothetical protein
VYRDHGQSTVARRVDDTIQSYWVEPQLVSTSNQITLRRYLDHVTSEERLAATQPLSQNNPSRFDVVPRAKPVAERVPLRLDET